MDIRIDLEELRHALATCQRLSNAVGTINPRPPGLQNDLIQHPKKLMSRLLDRYTRSQREFNSSVVRSLDILASSLENLQTTLQALDGRLTRLERDHAALTSSLQTGTAILATLESLANSQKSSGRETALSTMEGDWDKRAQDNSRFYSDTGHGESEEAFEQSGERNLEDQVLADIELSSQATVLELGCGIGRLLKPLAPRAAAVIGIDISSEMVRQAQERLGVFPNVRIHKTHGDLSPVETSSVDFCFCFAVFEHVPSKEPVFRYFEEASRVLRPGGIFRFQVNQRPEKCGRAQVADTWNGVGLDPAEVAAHLGQAGFRILDTWGEMSHNAWYTAEEAKKPRLNGPQARVLYHPMPLEAAASERVFARIGETPSASTLEGLLSRRLAWREA
ncbi:MAG TPA: methyltransferase domain-containing protein, partial [Terriglobia bacterium]|nr:methyltransferase domain-containing protein [Terriglobia bacterium]